MRGLQHDFPLNFNGRCDTMQSWAARVALQSWWADVPAKDFYARARQEAPRMRGSQGANWVAGFQIEQLRAAMRAR